MIISSKFFKVDNTNKTLTIDKTVLQENMEPSRDPENVLAIISTRTKELASFKLAHTVVEDEKILKETFIPSRYTTWKFPFMKGYKVYVVY